MSAQDDPHQLRLCADALRAARSMRFDATMGALGLMPHGKAGRDADARCRGALDLVRTLGLIVVMQAVFTGVPGATLHGGWA